MDFEKKIGKLIGMIVLLGDFVVRVQEKLDRKDPVSPIDIDVVSVALFASKLNYLFIKPYLFRSNLIL